MRMILASRIALHKIGQRNATAGIAENFLNINQHSMFDLPSNDQAGSNLGHAEQTMVLMEMMWIWVSVSFVDQFNWLYLSQIYSSWRVRCICFFDFFGTTVLESLWLKGEINNTAWELHEVDWWRPICKLTWLSKDLCNASTHYEIKWWLST